MVFILQSIIKFYQATLSPDHSPLFHGRYPHGFCRHYPTCSQYAYEALGRHGVIRGLFLASLRLLRCNPWARPSVDQVPANFLN